MACAGCARRRETLNRWARLAADRAKALFDRHGIKTPDQVEPQKTKYYGKEPSGIIVDELETHTAQKTIMKRSVMASAVDDLAKTKRDNKT